MSSFTTPLEYEATGAVSGWRPVYRVLAPFVYEVGDKGSGIEIHVPAGFETDFASVPRNPIIQPGGILAKSATVHDLLYRRAEVARPLADLIFLEAMAANSVPLWERRLCFAAVRCFGASSYARLPADYRYP